MCVPPTLWRSPLTDAAPPRRGIGSGAGRAGSRWAASTWPPGVRAAASGSWSASSTSPCGSESGYGRLSARLGRGLAEQRDDRRRLGRAQAGAGIPALGGLVADALGHVVAGDHVVEGGRVGVELGVGLA